MGIWWTRYGSGGQGMELVDLVDKMYEGANVVEVLDMSRIIFSRAIR